MNVKLTKQEALKIQAEQIAHYGARFPQTAEIVAAHTQADKLQDGVEYSVIEINRYIPRGEAIEALLGLDLS